MNVQDKSGSTAMASTIRTVESFTTTIPDRPGQACELLSQFARLGVNLVGLTAIPMGPESTWLTLYPSDSNLLLTAAKRLNVLLNGPHHALLVQGDDEMGALAGVLTKLAEAEVNVFGSFAVTDGKGHYGNIINLRPEHYERAVKALHL
jgi:prephenate dehydratase